MASAIAGDARAPPASREGQAPSRPAAAAPWHAADDAAGDVEPAARAGCVEGPVGGAPAGGRPGRPRRARARASVPLGLPPDAEPSRRGPRAPPRVGVAIDGAPLRDRARPRPAHADPGGGDRPARGA